MNEHLVTIEPFRYSEICYCPGQIHQHMIEFHHGDVWNIANEHKFIDGLGWYLLIEVNYEYQFYMHVDDIETLYNEGKICSSIDLDLKMNHLIYKVNEALDVLDRESFYSYTEKLNNIQKIKWNMSLILSK